MTMLVLLSITHAYKYTLHPVSCIFFSFKSPIYIMTRKFVIDDVTVCPPIPDDVTELVITNTSLTSLPALPSGLTKLVCDSNQLTSLPALPSGLTGLFCYSNQLTSLPALPSGLTTLGCHSNRLTSLPTLPRGLTELYCSENKLVSLPALPSGLTKLWCSRNQLASLPTLPNGLTQLVCVSNQLTSIPTLPSGLKQLWCWRNQLTSLPALPNGLTKLDCQRNQIVWCERIKDAKRIGIDTKKTALLLRFACKAIARQEAVTFIEWNCERWLEAPVTNDGRMGILLRMGMCENTGYGTWTGQDMWKTTKDGNVVWAGNDVDKEMWSMYPQK